MFLQEFMTCLTQGQQTFVVTRVISDAVFVKIGDCLKSEENKKKEKEYRGKREDNNLF